MDISPSRCTPLALAVLAATSLAHSQTFNILPGLPDSADWKANGVSANGRFITGYSVDPMTGSSTTVVWDENNAITPLTLYADLNQAFRAVFIFC